MHILGCVHLLRYLERTFLCLYDYSWWVGLDWTFVHMLDIGLVTRTTAYCGPFLVDRYLFQARGQIMINQNSYIHPIHGSPEKFQSLSAKSFSGVVEISCGSAIIILKKASQVCLRCLKVVSLKQVWYQRVNTIELIFRYLGCRTWQILLTWKACRVMPIIGTRICPCIKRRFCHQITCEFSMVTSPVRSHYRSKRKVLRAPFNGDDQVSLFCQQHLRVNSQSFYAT